MESNRPHSEAAPRGTPHSFKGITTAILEHAQRSNLPRSQGDQFVYGLSRPLHGIVLIWRDPVLLRQTLVPVLAVLALCAAATIFSDEVEAATGLSLMWVAVISFFAAFFALAPIPPVLFARQYARMAARARTQLGLGPSRPYLKSIRQSLSESIRQAAVIALGIAPVTLALKWIPAMGTAFALTVQVAWTLYWMTVEALDNGRTLSGDETIESVSAREASTPHRPWFARWLSSEQPRLVYLILTPLRWTLSLVERSSRDWNEEFRLIEQDPALASGFGLGIALLLAIPGVNLLFRPAIAISAACLRGQLERETAAH